MENKIEYTAEYLMKEALQKIANPIAYLQQEAKEQGAQLDGMGAIALANNANWLSSVAARALLEIGDIQAQQKILNDKEPQKEDKFPGDSFYDDMYGR